MLVNKERVVKEFSRLVAIDSPSFGERQKGDYLKEVLEALGLFIQEDDAGSRIGGNCGNIYGFLAGSGEEEPILLCAHMDTVEPAVGKQAIVGDDGIIRSRGDTVLGADDCSGITAILEALRVIKENKLAHRPVEILFTVAEEVYCKGVKAFDFSKIRSKEAYILDLSGFVGSAAYQAPSILSFKIAVHGRSAHAGFAPQDGIHAILAASDAITKIPMGKIGDDTTLNIGLINGGTATNIVPDSCTVNGEIRSYSHEKALEIAEKVKWQFIASADAIGAGVQFDLQVNCRAYETPLNSHVIKHFEKCCAGQNVPVSLIKTFGGSDNNVFAEHGISGIVLASAMNRCHSCEEYTTVDALLDTSALTLALLII